MSITQLEAINDILSAIDLPSVNSVNDDSYEVDLIKNTISQQKRLILSRGYFFNTFDKTFQNTNSNEVFVDRSVIKIDDTRYSLRGRQLWELAGNTGTITEPVTVSCIVQLDFDELPYECGYYIMTSSRVQVQTKIMPDPNTTQIYMMQQQEAKRLFNEYIIESNNANMLDGTGDIWQR